jgi:hypothetical protein
MNSTTRRHETQIRKYIMAAIAEGTEPQKISAKIWRTWGYMNEVKGDSLVVRMAQGTEVFSLAVRP